MSDFHTVLTEMRRPGLLMRAVRHVLRDAPRARALRRLAGPSHCRDTRISHLIETEARIEATRRAGDAGYSVARHIEVLAALVAEARPLFVIPAE